MARTKIDQINFIGFVMKYIVLTKPQKYQIKLIQMCLNDKEFPIEFLTLNLITLLSTLWGEIFAVFFGFTEKPRQ